MERGGVCMSFKNIINKISRYKMRLLLGLNFFLVCIFILFLLMTYFTNKEDVLLKKDLTCEFREKIYAMDFVRNLTGTVIENSLIDTSIVGKKKISFSYRNRYGLIATKHFEIEIKDVTPPTVIVNNPYVVEIGSVKNLVDTIFCADDYDDNVTCLILGSYDLDKVGIYHLQVTAMDYSNNTTTKDFTLHVVDHLKEDNSIKNNGGKHYTSFESVYKKYKQKDTLIGLDLSRWQEEVDFGKLEEQGVEFVMLKVGGQKEIGGEMIIDPKFYSNIQEAKAHNMKVGVYFYSYARSESDAKKQVKWIISKIKNYDFDLPIVFDWENWTTYTTFRISFHTLNKIASTFMKEVEKNGYDSMLYSSKYYLETIWYSEDYTTWLAYYTENNDYQGDYFMWQLCSDGKIEGIDGYVDIDVLKLKNKDIG